MGRTSSAEYRSRILRVERLLADRLDDKVPPAELAKAASFSLHHFHRIFRAEIGESVMGHARRLRLERAARRLRAGTARVVELALEAGFDSHEGFTRAFTTHFGSSPSEYRQQPSPRVSEWQRAPAPPRHTPIAVASLPSIHVAYRRHRGGYAGIDEFWAGMRAWAMERGLLERSALYGVCPDDPDVTEEALLRFDACVVVDAAFQPDSSVAIGEIPGGTYAIAVHRGPYRKLAETYLDLIGFWFPASGYELAADPVVEHYIDDPTLVPESELRTEVRVRIAE